MQILLWPLISWIFREIVVKFVVFAAIVLLVVELMPLVFAYAAPFVGVTNLTAAFAALPAGIWWGVDLFRLDIGVPLLISAYVARFLIRRLPVVG